MPTETQRTTAWFAPVLLLVAGAGVILAYATSAHQMHPDEVLAFAAVGGSCLLSGIVIFWRTRRPDAWRSALWLGLGVLGLGISSAVLFTLDLRGTALRSTPLDAAFLAVTVAFLVAAGIEFRGHVPREERWELTADVILLGLAIGTALFLLLRPAGAPPSVGSSAGAFALAAAAGFSAYAALALWLPNPAHLAMFATSCALSSAVLIFAPEWLAGTFRPGQAAVDLPVALGSLLLALVVWIIPARGEGSETHAARYGPALLTSLSVATACGALTLVATREIQHRIDTVGALALMGLLAAAIVIRVLVNQVRGTKAQRAVREALDQKEVALGQTDRALERLRAANETLSSSEERLRAVFESAVDGIVELDHKDVIVRANGAFCTMIELPQSLIEGHPWTALAASLETDESFANLPLTGQGTLQREGHAIYLESRTSEIPGDPPRRLLLVRDVTAARVADQTIRSLFKFLQDRDEDRTRIMRRTNAAIESERNRIARDLHDGPVQGVSAASLSLEAVLLMLQAGELDEGVSVLAKVRRELSEEADNLRRLMSGLRPPLLEERGLIPALRETLDRYGRDNRVRTEFMGQGPAEIPQDLETLAYRVVQEALANSTKHAKATSVTVSVESIGGQLRVEVVDDGVGFDSAKAREYLQSGRVGLASMRERVELANGTFMVHSTPGRGTTVLATLPLDAVPAAREFSVSEAS